MIYWWTSLFYKVLDRQAPPLLSLKTNKVGKQIFHHVKGVFILLQNISKGRVKHRN